MKRFLIAFLLSGVMMAEAVLPAVAAPAKAPLQEVFEEAEDGLFELEEVYEEEDALPELEEAFEEADDSLFEQEEVYEEVYEEDDIFEAEEMPANANYGWSTHYVSSLVGGQEPYLTYDGTEKKPTVRVTWSHNGEPVPASDYKVTYPSNPINVGIYSVTIRYTKEPGRTDTHYYRIIPPRVSIKKISNIKETSATVELSGSTIKIDGYRIAHYDNRVIRMSYVPATQTSVQITDLEPNKEYRIAVSSFLDIDGWRYFSNPSENIKFTTKAKRPSYTDEEILSKMEEIKNKEGYREGDFISRDLVNNNFKYTTDVIINYNDPQTINAVGVKALALDISDQIFGRLSPIYKHRDISHVRVGDIVIYEGGDLYAVVTKVKDRGQIEVVTGCPFEQKISWNRTKNLWSPFLRFNCIWTRRE